jgi:hypothetical protein
MKNEIDKDLEELEHLTARISENRKLLKLAEARALAKTVCLLDEMEIEEEQERIKNGGLSDGEMREVALERLTLQDAEGSSLVDWSVWGFLDGTSQEGVVTSESFDKAPRYFPLADSLPI